MDSSHHRRPRSWFLAALAAVVLFLGSIVFAASASAKDAPGTAAHPDQGEAATAHAQAAPRHRATPGAHTTGGSTVSLARPNSFQAQADPDGATNGGVDQPGGTGGVDTSTQDGNNGSGNDTDCEDDNRGVGVPGHCKDKTNQGQHTGEQSGEETGTTSDTASTTTSTTAATPAASAALLPALAPVLPGASTTQVSAPGGDSSVFVRDHSVAGISTTSTAAQGAGRPTASILPNTGASAALLALTLGGLAALATGGGLLRRSRAGA